MKLKNSSNIHFTKSYPNEIRIWKNPIEIKIWKNLIRFCTNLKILIGEDLEPLLYAS